MDFKRFCTTGLQALLYDYDMPTCEQKAASSMDWGGNAPLVTNGCANSTSVLRVSPGWARSVRVCTCVCVSRGSMGDGDVVRATVHKRVKDEGARPSVICSYLRVALQFIRESAAARKPETCRGVDAGGGADGYLVELAAGDGTLAYTVLHSPTLPWAQPAHGSSKARA